MTITIRRWDDPPSWNEFVASIPDTHFQQSWEWGEFAPELGSRAVRLGAIREGVLIGAMQVFVTPLAHTGRSLLYVPRGPAIFEPSLQLLGPLLDAARAIGYEEQALGIRLEPNVAECTEPWKCDLMALGLHPTYPPSQPRSSWVLDISPDPAALLAAMKQKTRYNIRLASRRGVEIVEGSERDLDAFYDLYRETGERDDFFILPKSHYARMFELFRRSGAFCMLLAYHEGCLLAAVTLLRFGQTCWYLHGASSNQHRNLMPMYLLQWAGIEWAKARGCTLYDFRAIPDVLREDQDMFGVYRFKEGFGGRQVTTLHTYAAAYQPGLFGLWQLYFSGRFALNGWLRRRRGLPARQFA